MGRARRENLQFPAVLRALHTATNRYEASFASKLVATLDCPCGKLIAGVRRGATGIMMSWSAKAKVYWGAGVQS
jgi:hypothetical protein